MNTLKFAMLGLLLAGFAHAAEMSASEADAASTQMDSAAPAKASAKAKRLPKGDLRYCLEMKTNEEIIRCAESRRKR